MRTGSITCADDGTFAVVLDLDTSQVYVEVDHSYMTSVGAGGFPAVRMDLDQECSKHTIYESVFVDSSETGHPPIDPYGGGGWGVPHFDVRKPSCRPLISFELQINYATLFNSLSLSSSPHLHCKPTSTRCTALWQQATASCS